LRIIGPIADRLLSLAAPKITAQAVYCCIPYTYTEYCFCSGGYVYQQHCQSDCCTTACTGCFKTTSTC